jgi:hypothetical protein
MHRRAVPRAYPAPSLSRGQCFTASTEYPKLSREVDPLLFSGLAATFFGTLWALFERDNPDYGTLILSKNQRNVINIVTGAILFGGYVLILLSDGSWLRNVGILVLWHFFGCQLLAGLLYGTIAGLVTKRLGGR